MNRPEIKALDITTEIVVAKMQSETYSATESSGKNVGKFFKEIYDSVLAITSNIKD